MQNRQIAINISTLLHVTYITTKRELHTAKLSVLIESVQTLFRRCNDLEKRLIKKGYSEREVRKQSLRARGFSRDSLLDRKNTREEQNKITFDLTYYPVTQNVKKI